MATLSSDADILGLLGRPDAPLLGSGGEAHVYALNANRVVRIMHPGASYSHAKIRASLVREIVAGAQHLGFSTPEVQSVMEKNGRVFVIEQLLPGTPVSQLLLEFAGSARSTLLANYLNVAGAISTIDIHRQFFGPLIDGDRFLARSWNGFLSIRLQQSLSDCPPDLREAVAATAQAKLPEPAQMSLVHLDYFPNNVLAQQTNISAVLDFGPSAVIGDARMEAWSAVAYLDREISPSANDSDRTQAMNWLATQNLIAHYPAARRWLAAFWSFAVDDAAVMAWCRRILLGTND